MLPLAHFRNQHKFRYAIVLVSTQKCCDLLTLMMLACLSLCLILHLWDKRCSPTNCQALSSKRWTKPSTLNNKKTCPERSQIQRSRDLRLPGEHLENCEVKIAVFQEDQPMLPILWKQKPKELRKVWRLPSHDCDKIPEQVHPKGGCIML